jgi:UDP-2-acetamido-2-deoxy-ribo-hexuluronate aminotransferase
MHLSVCNGTKGIMLAMMALNLKPNDEILVPEYCYISPINMCKLFNLKIKLVKINYLNLQIDHDDLRKKNFKKIKMPTFSP